MHALNLSLFDVTNVLVAMFFWCKISTKKSEISRASGGSTTWALQGL